MGNDRSSAWLQAFAGGGLAGLALSTPGWSSAGPWLMLPALALLWSIARCPPAAGLWGCVAVLVSHRWLLALHPLTWIGVPAALSLPVAVAIWSFCGLAAAGLVASWALLARWCRRSRWSTALLMASLWGLVEVLLASGPLFWIGVGSSLLPGDPLLAGLARWLGSGGLAACQLLAGWWLWQLVARRPLLWRRWLVAGLMALLVAHGCGWWLLHSVGSGAIPADSPSLARVGLWQPSLPTREKFSSEQQRRLPARLQRALQAAALQGADWLVAPEGTLPLERRLLEPAPLPLLSGGFRWTQGQQRSALLLVERGAQQPSAALDKHRLVPLGEWIPAWLGSAGGLSAVGGVTPGVADRLWRWDGPPAAVAICYELSDGAAIARAVGHGAEWLLAIANLDPYPLLLQRQFLALAQLRSIETNRPLLSVANTGPTAAVSATANVEQLLEPMLPGLAITELEPLIGMTPYVFWGERPLQLVVAVVVLARIRERVAGSSRRQAPSPRRKTPPPGQV